jgi:tyrosyl-DNA phosphodiesterase 2
VCRILAGRGIIAGDFNPVLPEDDDLVHTNNLIDAWAHLHPRSPGHTWGIYGEQSFPPNWLDKVSLLNLEPSDRGILRTSELGFCGEDASDNVPGSGLKAHLSDRFGLWCEVGWTEDRPGSEQQLYQD